MFSWPTRLEDPARLRSDRRVLGALLPLVRSGVAALVARVKTALWNACRPEGVVGGIIADITRSRSELIAENALLRQQLVVACRAVKRPALRAHERGLLVLLARLVPLWRGVLLLVKPEKVLRWHRRGFQLWWHLHSRNRRAPEPRLAPDVLSLRCPYSAVYTMIMGRRLEHSDCRDSQDSQFCRSSVSYSGARTSGCVYRTARGRRRGRKELATAP